MKREIFSEEQEKKSGFNTIAPYAKLVSRMLAVFGRPAGQSFNKTIELMINYLSEMEASDFSKRNNNLYINFRIELGKADLLPLFRGYSVKDVNIHYADYQYLKLMIKEMAYLYLELSDLLRLSPEAEGVRTLFSLERKFIEKLYNLIPQPKGKRTVEQDDLVDYVSIYNNLVSYIAGIRIGRNIPSGMTAVLNKLAEKNSELNTVLTEKFDFRYKSEMWNISYRSNARGIKTSQFA